jgi:hypothetical protein
MKTSEAIDIPISTKEDRHEQGAGMTRLSSLLTEKGGVAFQ